MWQITTHNLSIINTQGLFVVTQIAAVNLVTGKMTFAKVWVTSSVHKELRSTACDTSSPMCIKNGILSERTEAMFHTKGSGLAIMMSRYRLLTLACADTFDCMQTHTAGDYIDYYKRAFYLHPLSLYFWQNVSFKTPSATSLKQNRRSFWELNTLHGVQKLSQMIC